MASTALHRQSSPAPQATPRPRLRATVPGYTAPRRSTVATPPRRRAAAGSRPAARRTAPLRPVEAVRPARVPTPCRSTASAVLPTGHTQLRLTRRGRMCLVVLAAVLAALAFSAGRASGTTGAAAGQGNVSTASVVARSGDTLWSIARAAAPGRDPRITVEQLRRLNHLAGVQVVPGQQLLLPVRADTPS